MSLGGKREGSGRKARGHTKVLVSLHPVVLAKIDGEVKAGKSAGEKPAPSRGSVISKRFA